MLTFMSSQRASLVCGKLEQLEEVSFGESLVAHGLAEASLASLGARHQNSRSSPALSGLRMKKWSDYSENRRHNKAPDADVCI